MRRLTYLLGAGIISISLLSAAPGGAEAQVTAHVSGKVVANARIDQPGVRLSVCVVDTDDCTTVNPTRTGQFALDVPVGRYDINVFSNRLASPGDWFWDMWTTADITADAYWRLTLPRPVDIGIKALTAAGRPIVGAAVTGGEAAATPGQGTADDQQLSPDLPTFEVSSGPIAVGTNQLGKATARVFPQPPINLVVHHSYGGISDGRLPLDTESRTTVRARRDTDVVAQALPLRTVGVTVSDFTGRQLSGDLQVNSLWGDAYAQLGTSGYGSVRFPQGKVNLVVGVGSGPSNASGQVVQPLSLRDDRLVDLTLPKPVSVVTTVTDDDTGQPVENVRVDAGGYFSWPYNGFFDPQPYVLPDVTDPSRANDAVLGASLPPAALFSGGRTGKTHADGSVRFRVFADDSLNVSATQDQTGVFRETPTSYVDAGSDAEFELALAKSATLTIKARDALGSLIYGVDAKLRIDPEYVVDFTGDSRKLPVMKLDPGSHELNLQVPILHEGSLFGFLGLDTDVDVPADTSLRVVLPQTHQLRVRVVDVDGTPLAGVRISAVNRPFVQVNGSLIPGPSRSSGLTNDRGRATTYFLDAQYLRVDAYLDNGSAQVSGLDGTTDQDVELTLIGR